MTWLNAYYQIGLFLLGAGMGILSVGAWDKPFVIVGPFAMIIGTLHILRQQYEKRKVKTND